MVDVLIWLIFEVWFLFLYFIGLMLVCFRMNWVMSFDGVYVVDLFSLCSDALWYCFCLVV